MTGDETASDPYIEPDLGPDFLAIDAFSNALDYLKQGVVSLERLAGDPIRFKWAALCFSDALYGFLVCSLDEGHPSQLLRQQLLRQIETNDQDLSGTKTLEQIVMEHDKSYGYLLEKRRPLVTFDEALKRELGSPIENRLTGKTHPAMTEAELAPILKLRHLYRDEFAHFRPIGLGFHKGDIYPLIVATVKAIDRLVVSGEMVFKNESWEDIRSLCARALELLA